MSSTFIISIAAVYFFFSQTASAAECTLGQVMSFAVFFNSTEVQTDIKACEAETGAEESKEDDQTLAVAKEMCDNSNCRAAVDAILAFEVDDCEVKGGKTLKSQIEPILKQLRDAWTATCGGAASMTFSILLVVFCAMLLNL